MPVWIRTRNRIAFLTPGTIRIKRREAYHEVEHEDVNENWDEDEDNIPDSGVTSGAAKYSWH